MFFQKKESFSRQFHKLVSYNFSQYATHCEMLKEAMYFGGCWDYLESQTYYDMCKFDACQIRGDAALKNVYTMCQSFEAYVQQCMQLSGAKTSEEATKYVNATWREDARLGGLCSKRHFQKMPKIRYTEFRGCS